VTIPARFDPRITPARADLAAAHLKGKVEAERYERGRLMQIVRGCANLRKAPAGRAGMHTQLLFGEFFTVYEEKNGWAWGQAALDSYVGYVDAAALSDAAESVTHHVNALGTPLLTAPDVRSAAAEVLPLNAKLAIRSDLGRFVQIANGFYVSSRHVAPLTEQAPDWVAIAERFVGTPYVWGGKTYAGIDCSGLIQTAMEAAGLSAPRDTDMMVSSLGEALPFTADYDGLKRGDLVFWKGHVGVMQDAKQLLHANAWFMEVTSEPLVDAASRIAEMEGPVQAIKRLT
jgi:cell wall-associated NlpC family hydrolase